MGPGRLCPDAQAFVPFTANPTSHGLEKKIYTIFVEFGEDYLLQYLLLGTNDFFLTGKQSTSIINN